MTTSQKAILKTLGNSPIGMRGLEIVEQTNIPFFLFWKRNISFSSVYSDLKKLEILGLITSHLDKNNPESLTGACPAYYSIAGLGREYLSNIEKTILN